jgi:hypothetical protein
LTDPLVVTALQTNSEITGFCNLPQSIVHFKVKEEMKQKLYRKQYPIAHQLKPLVSQVIERWFKAGKIRIAPTGCAYNNALVVAPKKDKDGKITGIRPCLDTRPLNDALEDSDRFQLPHIRRSLESFAGGKIFGEFDLEDAYLQFLVHIDSQQYVAFTWEGKQYVFIGNPFGTKFLPSHFQRIMVQLFADMPFMFPYLDNLLFASKSWDEHRDHVLMIIERLNQVNLKLKMSSVNIGQSHLRCLGHLVSVQGVSIDQAKLKAIKEWPQPHTGEQLASFLGLIAYVGQHVRHFADLTAPLHEAKQQKVLEWTPRLMSHFDLVKQAICQAPVLAFPDFDKPFYIATDASNTGVGGVLYQPSETSDDITSFNIVGITSEKLDKTQLNYSAYKKELYGIVHCLRQFHSFVWGRRDLVIYTDHKPLTYMLSSSQLSPALQQWLDVILDYSFKIRHRPGTLNVLPDALSRMYASLYPSGKIWGTTNSDAVSIIKAYATVDFDLPSSESHGEGPSETQSVKQLLQAAGGSVVNSSKFIETLLDTTSDESELLPPSQETDEDYEKTNSQIDLLVEMEKRGFKRPATKEECIREVETAHLFGHFGRDAIFKNLLMKKQMWWPGMRNDIEHVLQNCDQCTRYVVGKRGFHPAQSIRSQGPWDHVQMDTSVHLPPGRNGFTTLLVVIDVFTGFVLLRAVKSTDAESVADALWKIFCDFGLPKIIQSDNGPEFVNEVIRAMVKLTGMDHRLISPYNPRADGKVERVIGSVTMIIKKMLHGTNEYWSLFVPFAQLSYNQKITELTGSSPFALMFGRTLNEMKDYTQSADHPLPINLNDWKSHQEKIISLVYPVISERINKGQDKMVQTLNKHRRTIIPSALPTGSVVMLNDPLRANKFEPKYVGPYTIVRRAHNGGYVLRDLTGDIFDRHVTADQLKLLTKASRKKDIDEPIYEVERVKDHKGNPGSYQYLVKWKGYDEETWEPQSNFLDDKVIQGYWKEWKANQQQP